MQTTPKMSLEKTFALTPALSPRSAGHYRRVVLLDTRAVLSAREDRCVGVPKGQSRIAQRFNAGLDAERSRVPKGRLRSNPTPDPSAFSRPFGTCEPCGMFPGVKTPGYSQDVPPGQRNLVAGFMGRNRQPAELSVATLLVFCSAGNRVLAERYLSLPEAQKVCFPQADRFEAQTVRPTPEEARAIEQKSGAKIRDRESRIWLARKGTNLLGVLVLDHVFGKHDVIDYAVAVSPEGKVLQVEILEYREHYGGEIRAAKWLEQFKGKSASAKLKLNDDIYNISGATISCRNVTDGVRRLLATFELVVRPRLLAAGRLPDAGAGP